MKLFRFCRMIYGVLYSETIKAVKMELNLRDVVLLKGFYLKAGTLKILRARTSHISLNHNRLVAASISATFVLFANNSPSVTAT